MAARDHCLSHPGNLVGYWYCHLDCASSNQNHLLPCWVPVTDHGQCHRVSCQGPLQGINVGFWKALAERALGGGQETTCLMLGCGLNMS